MTVYFKPRRGKKSTAVSQDIVLKHGEIFFEVPEEGAGAGKGKLKMGDGETHYSELPYFLSSDEGIVLTQEEFDALPPEQQKNGLYYIKDNSSTVDDDNAVIINTTEEVLDRSKNGGLVVNEIRGVSEQKSYTGKNLLDCRGLVETTDNGIKFTPVYDDNKNLLYVNANGTANGIASFRLDHAESLEKGKYILSGCPSGGSNTSYSIRGTRGFYGRDNGDGITGEYTVGEKLYIYIEIASGYTANNLKFYPMIRLASEVDDTYEPYVGTTPSPNPSYPQEIKSVVINSIKTYGKNMLDDTNITSGYKPENSDVYRKVLKLKPNTEYTISQIKNSDSGHSLVFAIGGIDLDLTPSTAVNGCTIGNSRTVTSSKNGYITVGLYENSKGCCQLEEGPIATEYKPYEGTEVTLSNPIELNGINDVYDIVTPEGITRRFGKVVFDGSEDELWGYYETGDTGWLINQNLISTEKIPTGTDIVPNVLCSMAKVTSRDDLLNNKNSLAISSNGNLNINNDYGNVDDWKVFLQSNPMTVVYELATPVVEELSDVDKIALNSLKTFNEITYISSDSEIKPIIDVDYGINKAASLLLENDNKNDIQDIKINNIIENATKVIDNLDSVDSEAALSANMGRQLKEDIENSTNNIINTTENTLDNSHEGGLVLNNIYGKTEQKSYTGKNLFKMREDSVSSLGITVTFDKENQSFTATGKSTGDLSVPVCGYGAEIINMLNRGGTYVLSLVNTVYHSTQCNISICYEDAQGTKYIKTDGVPVTISSGSTLKGMNLWIPSDTTLNLNNVKIQLEEASVATPWEPYVGGTPSPNPSYPQEIKSVKGKNLLDCRGLTEQTKNGGTFTPIFDDNGNLEYINVNGTFSADTSYHLPTIKTKINESYTINGCPSGGSDTSYRLRAQGYANDIGNGATWKTISTITDIGVIIEVFNGTVCNNLKFYPMIRKASIIDDTYVPYGLLSLRTTCKNMIKNSQTFSKSDFRAEGGWSILAEKYNGLSIASRNTSWCGVFPNNLYIEAGKTYTFSAFARTNVAHEGSYIYITNRFSTASVSLASKSIKINTDWQRYSISFTCINSGYINPRLEVNVNGITLDVCGFQLEEGLEMTEYQPYEKSEVILSNPVELNGLNDVYDVLTTEGIIRRFNKVVFDGSDDENWIIDKGTEYCRYIIELPEIAGSKSERLSNFVCTHGLYSKFGANTGCAFFYKTDNDTKFYIYANENTSLDDWKVFLQSNPMTVVYELATPVLEELPTIDKIALNSFKTFEGTTYVESDSELKPIIDVDYGCTDVGAISLKNKNDIQDIKINNIDNDEVSKDIINTTETVLEKSKEGGLVINEIQGKSEQKSYTGKNLLECRKLTERTINGITYTPVYENGMLQYINVNGTATEQSTYPLLDVRLENDTEKQLYVTGCYEGSSSTFSICTGYYDENGTWKYESYNTNGNMPVDKNYAKYDLCILVRKGITVNNVKFYPMISLEGGEYEPYVGGKPSPSPDYPQEIKSVKGKNLLNCTERTVVTKNNITFTPVYDSNKNLLYVNVNGTNTEATYYGLADFKLEGKFIASNLGGSYLKKSDGTWIKTISEEELIDIPAGSGYYLQAQIYIPANEVCDNRKIYPMIRPASIIDNTYVPYGLLKFKTYGKNLLDMSSSEKTRTMDYDKNRNSYVQTSEDTRTDLWLRVSLYKSWDVEGQHILVYDHSKQTAGLITGSFTKLAGYNSLYIRHNGTAKDVGMFFNIRHLKDDVKYYFEFRVVNATQGSIEFSNIMISEEESDYIPYEGTEVTLSKPIELNGVNDVYDSITTEGIIRRFVEYTFTGDEGNIRLHANGRIYAPIPSLPNMLKSESNALCTIATNDYSVKAHSNGNYFHFGSSGVYFAVNDSFSTAEEFIEYVKANTVKCILELATPVVEELPTIDKIALNSLKTFDNITYIESYSGEIKPIIDVDYGCTDVGATSLQNKNDIVVTNLKEVEIVDNLDSTDSNKPLSANMGRELNQKLTKVLYIKSFDPETGTLETVSVEPDSQEV